MYKSILDKAKSQQPAIQRLFKRLKKKKSAELDPIFHEEHERAFSEIDCMQCANCCKTTSPIVEQKDIQRISAHLKITGGDFVQKYLFMDEDGDFVFKQTPCPFLLADNACSIYESRPKACSEYPHTNRKNMHAILDITYENTFICPAVAKIVEKIQKIYDWRITNYELSILKA